MEDYLVMKKNDLQIHAWIQTNLKHMLKEEEHKTMLTIGMHEYEILEEAKRI